MKNYYRTNEQEEEKEDPQPLTDEKFAEYQKKRGGKVRSSPSLSISSPAFSSDPPPT